MCGWYSWSGPLDPDERAPLLLVASLLIAGTVIYVLAGSGILVSFFTSLTKKTLEMQAERIRARQAAREHPR